MLYEPPRNSRISDLDAELESLKVVLRRGLDQPRPWTLPLRRQLQASSWVSSIRIEGFELSEARADRLAGRSSEAVAVDQNEKAFLAYARAMEHVSVLAMDPWFEWSERIILDLHFDACGFQNDRHPGLVRTGPISVTSPTGGIAYTAPEASELRQLMKEFAMSLVGDLSGSVAVAAAMAHLNLVSIHPFEDGNGRISRIIQSLVLAREGILAPEFGSIEQYLAEHTDRYYAVLMEVQRGSFSPKNDAAPWVEFCLRAHIDQAKARISVIEFAASRWDRLERLVAERGWDERFVIALEQALSGSTDRASYVSEAGIANPTASNDLRRMLDAGMLEVTGSGRATAYRPTDWLVKYGAGEDDA